MKIENHEIYDFKTICPDILTPKYSGFKLYEVPLVIARDKNPEIDNLAIKIGVKCSITNDINKLTFFLIVNESDVNNYEIMAKEWIDLNSMRISKTKVDKKISLYDVSEDDVTLILETIRKMGYKVGI